jgi:hypothetical protein
MEAASSAMMDLQFIKSLLMLHLTSQEARFAIKDFE